MEVKYDRDKPKMLESVVCYIDILGYKQMIEEAFRNNSGDSLLVEIDEAIKDALDFIKPRSESSGTMKIFTDNIVIGKPIHDDGEIELGHTFDSFSSYQVALALKGFFVRGAITIGEFYMNEQTVFGPALLEAYNLENQKASEPRIILSDDSKKLVKEHLSYYAGRLGPQKKFLLKDSDGQWFINYLYSLIEYGEYIEHKQASLDLLMQHKEQIIKKLEKFLNEPPILRKYIWVANYHNYFSDEYFHGEVELKINIDLFLIKPAQIE